MRKLCPVCQERLATYRRKRKRGHSDVAADRMHELCAQCYRAEADRNLVFYRWASPQRRETGGHILAEG